MFKLDDNLLRELGLGGLPPAEKNKMLAHIYETLEMRVGMRLAEQMSNEQLDEFERFIDANDEAGALKWLESNFPNYKDVVADELQKLKAEIKTAAPQIMAASQQQPVGPPPETRPQTPPGIALHQAQPAQGASQPQPSNQPAFNQQQPPMLSQPPMPPAPGPSPMQPPVDPGQQPPQQPPMAS